MSACIALLDMTTERGGATQLNGTHHAPLGTTEPVGMGVPILWAAAEDVRHFESRSHRRVQKYAGGVGSGGMGVGCGSRSKGLVVAHTVLVATFK